MLFHANQAQHSSDFRGLNKKTPDVSVKFVLLSKKRLTSGTSRDSSGKYLTHFSPKSRGFSIYFIVNPGLWRFLSVLLFLGLSPLKGCGKSAQKEIIIITTSDSVTAPANLYFHQNFLMRCLFGNHYRSIWETPVRFPVFNSQTVKGGLTPLKSGGGVQTTSVHFTDSLGRRFVLRSIDKDPTSLLPDLLRTTFIGWIFHDQMSADNPYAALVIPDMEEALNIPHTHPVYYFVPKNADLGNFGNELKNKVAMLEEKPNSSWKKSPRWGKPKDITNTEEMLEYIFKDQNALIDQQQVLRARLFDLIINDWDRHTDQWAWLKFKRNDSLIFEPLPRDRDEAFYKADDGIFPLLTLYLAPHIKFQSFGPDYPDIKGLIHNANYVDHQFLNRLNWGDWEKEIHFIQTHLTNNTIHQSLKRWPSPIYEQIGTETEKALISRRDNLESAANTFYRIINKKVVIHATDKNESIQVTRLSDSTKVEIHSRETGLKLYARAFSNSITRELSLYALDGEDILEVKGNVKKGILINLYGGKGKDEILAQSSVKGISKKTRVYDSREGNILVLGHEASNRTSDNKELLDYNRTGKRK